MLKPLFTAALTIIWALGFSQDHLLRFEAYLNVENDAFTGNLSQDQYYSSGIYPAFRMVLDSCKNTKRIRTYQLNHRMYTPRWVGWTNPVVFDRPYAGVFSLSAANEYYFSTGQYLKIELEAGILGPHAYVGNAQRTWHQWFNMQHPNGWKYQISDSPMLNLNLRGIQTLLYIKKLDVFSETSASFGTVFNYLREDLVLRIGDIKPINQSAYVGSTLGNYGKKQKGQTVREAYVFYSPGMEWVLYNATLEGNLIGEKSFQTMDATKYVWQHRAGFIFSWPVFDFGIIATWRKRENPEANNHNYVGIRLTQRF